MNLKRIAAIAGDGIGKKVLTAGVRAASAAARSFGIKVSIVPLHN